jgi:biotin carboxylase
MKRLLILASKLGYQTQSFAEAARSLGVAVVFATDRCHQLDDPWSDGAIALHFDRPEEAAQLIEEKALTQHIDALIALGDRPTTTAAYAASALNIMYNSPEAVENCRSKLRQREILSDSGLPVPGFFSFRLNESMESVLRKTQFPCVLKPLRLAASQGVIRTNNSREFTAAVERIRSMLLSADIQATREPDLDQLLVEHYIPGAEVAVEGLLTNGRLRILSIFDKPNPLVGPYFEETIYVTPTRLPDEMQARIVDCAAATCRALGLHHGPVHAEFRVNDLGPWVLEAAPRPIGGLCSRALRFGPQRILLEELLVRHALEIGGSDLEREADASGVIMIPVPKAGVFEGVEGEDEARATPGIEDVRITARLHDFIAAWPEGSSYLGFIFARGDSPQAVESSLRLAHSRLRFEIAPRLPVEHPVTGKIARA